MSWSRSSGRLLHFLSFFGFLQACYWCKTCWLAHSVANDVVCIYWRGALPLVCRRYYFWSDRIFNAAWIIRVKLMLWAALNDLNIIIIVGLCQFLDLCRWHSQAWILDSLLQELQFLLCFAQLAKHASLLKDRVGHHKVLTSILSTTDDLIRRVGHDYHQGTDNLLCLSKLNTAFSIQDHLKVFYLLQLLQGLLKSVAAQVYNGQVSLDLAGSNIFHSIASLIDIFGFLEVCQSVLNLTSLLLPSA